MKRQKKIHYAFIILIAVSIIRGFSGPAINASSGLFLKPVSEELGVGIGQLTLYLSISSIASLIWLPIAGNILNKCSVKLVACASAVIQALAFIFLGTAKSVWMFYVMAVPLAMSSALLVNLMGPVVINRWFAARQGVIMGAMMTITSLLGAVFQPLLTNMIATKGWRSTYFFFGVFALFAMVIIAFFFLKNRPEDIGALPVGAESDSSASQENITFSHGIQNGVTVKRAVKSLAFFMLVLFMIILTAFASFSQHVTTFGLDLGYSITTIGTALSLSMTGSAIGSVLIGIFSDKIGITATSIAVMAVGFVSICLFFFGGQTFFIFATAALLHGLATSSIGVVAPLLTSAFFGTKEYEKLFSLVMMGSPFASIILMPAFGFAYDFFGNYNLVLGFLLAALLAGAVGIYVGRRNSLKL